MKTYPQLMGRLFGRPLLVTPEKAEILLGVFQTHFKKQGDLILPDGREVSLEELSDKATSISAGPTATRKIYRSQDGIAIIPVEGTLVNKNGLDPYSGMTGYDGISAKLWAAVADPDIDGVMLDIESPGGEVSGCFDLADEIREATATKPVWAVLSEYAYSAAYALASQCDRIILPRTGGVGSVGVVTMHADYSAFLEKSGVNVTLIHGGAHKVDGNPYAPLPTDVQARIQQDIDAVYKMFVDLVAGGRDMTSEAVKATEASTFDGEAGVSVGFADEILSPKQAFQSFKEFLSSRGSGVTFGAQAHTEQSTKEITMDDTTTAQAADTNEPDMTAAIAAAKSKGATEERARICGILQCEEAGGRTTLATHLAVNTATTVEDAKATLAVSPKEQEASPAATIDPLAQAMTDEDNPDVTAEGGDTGMSEDDKVVARMASNYRSAKGLSAR